MTDPYEHTDAFWLGRLSACVGEAGARVKERDVRESLRECLSEFIESPVPTEELRAILRRYVK